jgi:hypothetical protein
LQLIQAHFVAFNLKNPEQGRAIIKKTLDLQLNDYQEAKAKMEFGYFTFRRKNSTRH